MRHLIVDISNLAHRARHAINNVHVGKTMYDPFGEEDNSNQIDMVVGLTLSIVFNGILNAYDQFGATHVVAAFDKSSWRRCVFPEYKENRRNKVMTPTDERNKQAIIQTIDEVYDFLQKYTNFTVLRHTDAEADDFIARWVQIHHDQENVIMSGDSDFKQLVTNTTSIYNPLSRELYTNDGIFHRDKRKGKGKPEYFHLEQFWYNKLDKDGNPLNFDPKWELFFKIIRGDRSDNISSAWPRVRVTKMKEAFLGDTHLYNNFINSTWGPDNQHSVRELFMRNQSLIDLTCQPNDVKNMLDTTIFDAIDCEPAKMIGAYFANFCCKYRLDNMSKQADRFTTMFASAY